jgi:hypothetical protein
VARLSKRTQNFTGVKIGTTFAKWGNLDENLLNVFTPIFILSLFIYCKFAIV